MSKPKPVSSVQLIPSEKTHSEATKQGIFKARSNGTVRGVHGSNLAQTNQEKAKATAEAMRPVLLDICSYRGMLGPKERINAKRIAEELNSRGYSTEQGNDWHPTTVRRLIKRLGSEFRAEARVAADTRHKSELLINRPEDGEQVWKYMHQNTP